MMSFDERITQDSLIFFLCFFSTVNIEITFFLLFSARTFLVTTLSKLGFGLKKIIFDDIVRNDAVSGFRAWGIFFPIIFFLLIIGQLKSDEREKYVDCTQGERS